MKFDSESFSSAVVTHVVKSVHPRYIFTGAAEQYFERLVSVLFGRRKIKILAAICEPWTWEDADTILLHREAQVAILTLPAPIFPLSLRPLYAANVKPVTDMTEVVWMGFQMCVMGLHVLSFESISNFSK